MDPSEVKFLLDRAFFDALDTCDDNTAPLEKSNAFVMQLINLFNEEYKKNGIRVNAYPKPSKPSHCLKEVLFDIVVYRTERTQSPKGRALIPVIENAMWLIESEFAESKARSLKSRDLVYDLSKLALGSAEHKMLITSIAWFERCIAWVKSTASIVARGSKGKFFIGFVPHPYDWDQGRITDPQLILWQNTDWVEVV